MRGITLYIYNKSDNLFLGKDTGRPSDIFHDLKIDTDFTLTPPPDDKRIWRWINNTWVADEVREEIVPIEDKQNTVWEAIKSKRLESITNGIHLESIDKVFHTDNISSIQYSTIAGMIALGTYEPIPWKVMDNSWVILTVELLKEIQVAMSVKTNKNYEVAEQHKAAMILVNNPFTYDYSAGWV